MRGAKAWDERVVPRLLGHPHYALLLARTERLAGRMTPRALGNFIWGGAGWGEGGGAAHTPVYACGQP